MTEKPSLSRRIPVAIVTGFSAAERPRSSMRPEVACAVQDSSRGERVRRSRAGPPALYQQQRRGHRARKRLPVLYRKVISSAR